MSQYSAVASEHRRSRPYIAGLAAASAGIVALSLITAPPPGGAPRAVPYVVQLESQMVQLEALIVRSAVAALPTPVTGSSASASTRPAATSQHTANAALPAQTDPITAILQQIGNAINLIGQWAAALLFAGFVIGSLVFAAVTDTLLNLLFPPSPATASQVKTTLGVNNLVQPITAAFNATKAPTGAAAPIRQTLTPKPLSAAATNGPVLGSPHVSGTAPAAHSGLRTAVTLMTSNLSKALQHAGSTPSKKP